MLIFIKCQRLLVLKVIKMLTNLKRFKNINIINAARIKLTLGDPYLKFPHVFFCSFQKSGRTWLRFILGNYLNIKFELRLALDFHNIYSVLPSLTKKKQIAEAYKLLAPLNTPLIFFTHSMCDELSVFLGPRAFSFGIGL